MCVRRNVQHRELKLSKSTRFALVTVVMVAVPTGCVVSPPPRFSQNMQSHEKSPTSHRAQGVPPTVSLALGANRKGKGRVKGKASRIQSSRIGCALVCVRRNAQHPELKLSESTRFVLKTVLMVAVSTRGPTGASPPPLSSQNIQSHEKSFTSPRARGEAPTTSFVLGTKMYVCMYVCMYIYLIAHNRAIRPCHPSHSMPLASILPCMYVCIVITDSRVWINRERLPILLVVS